MKNMQKVQCISESPTTKSIKAGNLYYLDMRSVVGTYDGDWYADIYDYDHKELWIGHFLLRHFKTVS